MSRFDMRILSLGAGVQSACVYLMGVLGEIEPFDFAIFANTQAEPPHVYACLDRLESEFGHICPILRPSGGSLTDYIERAVAAPKGEALRIPSVPFWTENPDAVGESPSLRTCTAELKIDVVEQEIRRLLGLKKGQRAAGKYRVEQAIGISIDEVGRASPNRKSWIENCWPLLYEKPMRRSDCVEWFDSHGFDQPGRSACTYCPYRQPLEYARMRENDPETFAEACRVDDLLRVNGPIGDMRGLQYVWRKLKPLREIPPISELDGSDQMELWDSQCGGGCGL